jgi:hypothetical protein
MRFSWSARRASSWSRFWNSASMRFCARVAGLGEHALGVDEAELGLRLGGERRQDQAQQQDCSKNHFLAASETVTEGEL